MPRVRFDSAILLFLVVFAGRLCAEIVQYPALEGVPRNGDFTVRVRQRDAAWQDVAVYGVDVNMRHVTRAAMAEFDFSGPVEISVTSNRGPIEHARIRPSSAGIAADVKGDTLTFTLDRPRDLSIEVNGDIYRNLHLFTNAPETNVPSPNDPNVVYLGPGLHEFPATLDIGVDRVVNGRFGTQSVATSVLDVPSGKTLYLAPGAVLKAAVRCRGVHDVRICGRGILWQGREGFQIVHSSNVSIDGVTVVDSGHYTIFGGDVHGLTIRHLRAFSCVGNGDGIDLMSSTDVRIEDVFLRNSDDTIALYGHRWNFYGDVRNVTVRNAILWADVAHPIHMGTHGDPAQPEVLEHMLFSNIDILEHNEPQIGYQGCLSINVSDENLARDIRFEDIRVDDFTAGQLVNLRVAFNKKYCTAPGRGIENVTFKNLSYTGTHANISIIEGYDDARSIRNVVFENLTINGREMSWRMPKPGYYLVSDLAGFYVGPHVEGLEFLPPGGQRRRSAPTIETARAAPRRDGSKNPKRQTSKLQINGKSEFRNPSDPERRNTDLR